MKEEEEIIEGETEYYNPFTVNLQQPTNQSVRLKKLGDAKDRQLVDSEGNVIVDAKIIYAQEILNDKEPFIKLYRGNLDYLSNLSKIGIKLLVFILKNIKWNKDIILLDIKLISEETGYKNTSNIYRGIKELIDNKVIAKSAIPAVYWINVTKFYTGERRFAKLNSGI